MQTLVDLYPHLAGDRARALTQELCHSGQQVGGGLSPANVAHESGEHVIWTCASSVHGDVGEGLQARSHRQQQGGDDRDRDHVEQRIGACALAEEAAHAGHYDCVRNGDEDGEPGEEDGPVDDHIDVVEAVANHGDADGDRDEDRPRDEAGEASPGRDAGTSIRPRKSLERLVDEGGEPIQASQPLDVTQERGDHIDRHRVREPFQLPARRAAGAGHAHDHACTRHQPDPRQPDERTRRPTERGA